MSVASFVASVADLAHTLFRDRDAIGIAHQFAFRRRQTCAFVRLDQIE